MNIIIKQIDYPIDSLYKFFNITFHEPLEWGRRIDNPEKYLYIEGSKESLNKIVDYFDIEEFATIDQSPDMTEHLFIKDKDTDKPEYYCLLMDGSREQIKEHKLMYLHFKYSGFYLTFNSQSMLRAAKCKH